MSEPTLTFNHQTTLQSAPPQVAPVQPQSPVPLATEQYQSPLATTPDRYQEPVQFMQNSVVPPTISSEPLTSTTAPLPPQDQPSQAPPAQDRTPSAQGLPPTQNERFPGITKPIVEEVVVEWESPSRPHKQRQKQYFTTIAVFVFLIGLILFFLSQFLLIAVVVAVAFLVYVLEVVPPTTVSHQITTFGIRIENNLYYWEELGRYWFTEKYDQRLLHVEVARFPGRLTMLLGDLPQEAMDDLLSEVLIHQRPAPTVFEKVADRLQQLIPLENEKSNA